MWKKQQPEPHPTASPAIAPSRPAPRPAAAVASIGPSISLKGDISGEEDLVIEGHIQGEIKFHNHSVTVGRKGRVQADVYGKSICIEGQVFGNLWGQEEVVIRQTGKVEGNLTAPRVTLEDGSSFRGAIDMQSPQARAAKAQAPRSSGAETPKPSAPAAAGNRPAVQAKQS